MALIPLLRKLIRDRQISGTAAEIAAALNAKTERITRSELVTVAGLIERLGPDAVDRGLAAIEAAAGNKPVLRAVLQKLTSTGIDFSHPTSQQMIDQLQQQNVLPADIADALRNIGVEMRSPYEMVAGEGQVVDEATVQLALEPPAITGRRMMMSVVYSPDGLVASGMVHNMEGQHESDEVERFSIRSDRAAMATPAQQQLLSAVEQAVRAYLGV